MRQVHTPVGSTQHFLSKSRWKVCSLEDIQIVRWVINKHTLGILAVILLDYC